MNDERLLQLIDQCVLCGLCLPHCPTFNQQGIEPESPRGRIMAVQALARGLITPEAFDPTALNHCLLCRSCEAFCPSEVKFSAILTAGKAKLPQRHPAEQRLLNAVESPVQLNLLNHLSHLYQRSGLQFMVRKSGLMSSELAHLDGLLPTPAPFTPAPKPRRPAAPPPTRGTVLLFHGCMGDALEQNALAAARILLEQIGFQVKESRDTLCCGALHYHAGALASADRLTLQTTEALTQLGVDQVVGLSSSCIARLAESLPLPVSELSTFLLHHWPDDQPLAPLPIRVALHQPCSSRHWLKNSADTAALLARIPQLTVELLPLSGCCGASGSHLLSDPTHAQSFLEPPLNWLAEQAAATPPLEAVVSANLGCSLHLQQGLRQRQLPIRVLHPVQLLLKSGQWVAER